MSRGSVTSILRALAVSATGGMNSRADEVMVWMGGRNDRRQPAPPPPPAS
jgi:hypothetical protein